MKDEAHTSQGKSIYPVAGQDFVVDIGRFWEEGMKQGSLSTTKKRGSGVDLGGTVLCDPMGVFWECK